MQEMIQSLQSMKPAEKKKFMDFVTNLKSQHSANNRKNVAETKPRVDHSPKETCKKKVEDEGECADEGELDSESTITVSDVDGDFENPED